MSYDNRKDAPVLVPATDKAALLAKSEQPLARQLAILFFAAAVALVLLISGILYWGTLSALQSADDQVIDKRAGTVLEILTADQLNEGSLAHEVNEDNQGPRQIFMRVVSSYEPIALETEGMQKLLPAAIFPSIDTSEKNIVRTILKLADGRTYRASVQSVRVQAIPDGSPVIVQVAVDTTLDETSISKFQRVLFASILLAIPLCAFAAWQLVKRALVPLQRIAKAADAIHGSNIDQRIALAGMPAELHALASNFNAMLTRLEGTYADLKHYADALAHELRTPLNRMRLGHEIALNQANTEDDYREVLTSSVAECERLTRLLQGLLFLARAESHQVLANRSNIDVNKQLEKIHDFFEADASERSVSLRVNCQPELKASVDPDLLLQALTNLVANALDYTPAGGSIAIDAIGKENEVVIAVIDTGKGIAPEHHERLFDRYYRASQSSSTSEHGGRLGLGLAIVKSIALLHGGDVAVSSSVGQGSRFTLTLPTASKSKATAAPAGS